MDPATITAVAALIGTFVALLAELRRWRRPPSDKKEQR
jgi:hypothetical protein